MDQHKEKSETDEVFVIFKANDFKKAFCTQEKKKMSLLHYIVRSDVPVPRREIPTAKSGLFTTRTDSSITYLDVTVGTLWLAHDCYTIDTLELTRSKAKLGSCAWIEDGFARPLIVHSIGILSV